MVLLTGSLLVKRPNVLPATWRFYIHSNKILVLFPWLLLIIFRIFSVFGRPADPLLLRTLYSRVRALVPDLPTVATFTIW
jgi:hypothetical protein